MNILVTGGAGFIGSTIVDEYVRSGHRVWVIDNESSGKRKQVNPKAVFIRADVRNSGDIKRRLKSIKLDIINHHAAQIDVRKSVSDPVMDAEINIIGILNMLQLGVEKKIRKFIFSSSGGTVYGECRRPAKELDPEVPLSPYGVAKLASEKYIQAFSSLHGMNYTIFRYSNVYGPRQDPHGEAGVVAIFSQKILSNKPPIVFGNGRQTRDFVFVKDVSRANLLALRKANNQILNIGSGKETSVIELLKTMEALSDYTMKIIFKPGRSGELSRSVLSSVKAKKNLDWENQYSLKKGLSETFDYFRQLTVKH